MHFYCVIVFKVRRLVYLQEVVLQRLSEQEKLGLTLCYGPTEDGVTDIFVGEVSSEPTTVLQILVSCFMLEIVSGQQEP